MDDGTRVWLILKIISNLTATKIINTIWNYLKKKPLGMQTLFDSTIIDSFRIISFNFITSSTLYIKVQDNYSHEVSMTLINLNRFVVLAWFFQAFFVMIIRYLSIFHQGFLNRFEDHKVIFAIRSLVTILSALAVLDDFNMEGPEYSYLVGKEMDPEKIPKFRLFKAILILELLLVIFVQVKIKLLDGRINSNIPGHVLEMMKQRVAKRSRRTKVQFILLVTFIFILVSIEYLVSMRSITKTLRTRVIVQTLVTIVIPVIWMKNNKRFFDYLSKCILDVPVLPPHELLWHDLKSIFNINKVSPIEKGVFRIIGLPIIQSQAQFLVMNMSQHEPEPVLPIEQNPSSMLPTAQGSSNLEAEEIQTLPNSFQDSSGYQIFPEVEC